MNCCVPNFHLTFYGPSNGVVSRRDSNQYSCFATKKYWHLLFRVNPVLIFATRFVLLELPVVLPDTGGPQQFGSTPSFSSPTLAPSILHGYARGLRGARFLSLGFVAAAAASPPAAATSVPEAPGSVLFVVAHFLPSLLRGAMDSVLSVPCLSVLLAICAGPFHDWSFPSS